MNLFKNLRGVKSLHVAKMLTDTQESLTYETPIRFAGVREIGNDPEESSTTEFYDNQGAIVIDGEGTDVYSIVCSIVSDDVRAVIEGRKYDETTGEYMATPTDKPYVAIGFIGTDTDNIDYAYWVLKGKLNGGGEKYQTKNDGTDSTNLEYECNSIYTDHKFEKADGKSLKYYKVPVSKLTSVDDWFKNVTTPENVKLKSDTPAPTNAKTVK